MLAFAAVAVVISSAAGGAAQASDPLLPGGDPLQRLRAEQSRAAARDPSHRAGIIWLTLASGATLLVVVSAIQTKRPPRLARVGAQSPEGGAQMRRNQAEEHAGAPEVKQEQGDGFAELGHHVAAVLATAREAAERIEADARREVSVMLGRAQSEAAELLTGAREKAAKVEAEAARKRQEAEEAATELVARAERQARDRAQVAEARRQALDANVKRTETRLRELATGLRELAGRLDVLIGSERGDLDEELKEQAARRDDGEATPSAAGRSGQEA
jgi:vacuolar-type H+-ATPase subunit E/Vma4